MDKAERRRKYGPAPTVPGASVVSVNLGEREHALLRILAKLYTEEKNDRSTLIRKAINIMGASIPEADVEAEIQAEKERKRPRSENWQRRAR